MTDKVELREGIVSEAKKKKQEEGSGIDDQGGYFRPSVNLLPFFGNPPSQLRI